jgi:DNA polymerase-3 subunit alpha
LILWAHIGLNCWLCLKKRPELGQRYQKDHASGQIGLFEDESFDDVNDIKLPDLDEMPRALQLKDEKELLGLLCDRSSFG